MRWSDIIYLIAETYPDGARTDANGFPLRPIETPRKVYANKKSVGRSEYLKSMETGMKLALLFDVRSVEYKGEELLEHRGKRYRVEKTFVRGNGEITELKVSDLSERGSAGGVD